MILISLYPSLCFLFKIEKTNQQLELNEKKKNLNLIWDQVYNLISTNNDDEKKKRKSVLFNNDNSPSNNNNHQQMKGNQNKERMRSLIIQLKND